MIIHRAFLKEYITIIARSIQERIAIDYSIYYFCAEYSIL